MKRRGLHVFSYAYVRRNAP